MTSKTVRSDFPQKNPNTSGKYQYPTGVQQTFQGSFHGESDSPTNQGLSNKFHNSNRPQAEYGGAQRPKSPSRVSEANRGRSLINDQRFDAGDSLTRGGAKRVIEPQNVYAEDTSQKNYRHSQEGEDDGMETMSITEEFDPNKVKTSKLYQKFIQNETKENPNKQNQQRDIRNNPLRSSSQNRDFKDEVGRGRSLSPKPPQQQNTKQNQGQYGQGYPNPNQQFNERNDGNHRFRKESNEAPGDGKHKMDV